MIRVTKMKSTNGKINKSKDLFFHGVEEGDVTEFGLRKFPPIEVGKSFAIDDTRSWLVTSVIKKIIKDTDKEKVFETLNSIYKIELV